MDTMFLLRVPEHERSRCHNRAMADSLPGGWLPPQAPDAAATARAGAAAGARSSSASAARRARTGWRSPRSCAGSRASRLLALSLGLSFPFSLPLGITGWICAVRARVDVRAGQRKAGLVLAIAAVALSALAAVVWVALIAAGFSVEELQRNLENELERQRRADG